MLEEAVGELECRFTKFGEITQSKGHYAVQGHSRSLILVPIESLYAIIVTYLLSCTVSKLLSIFSLAREGYLTLTLSRGVIPCRYHHK